MKCYLQVAAMAMLLFVCTVLKSQDQKSVFQSTQWTNSSSQIAKSVYKSIENDEVFFKQRPFQITEKLIQENHVLKQSIHATLESKILNEIYTNAPENVELEIPNETGEWIRVLLVKADIVADGFRVVSSSSRNKNLNISDGIHYRGIIENESASIVALSVFKDEMMGMVSTENNGRIVIHPSVNSKSDYIIYKDSDLKYKPNIGCDIDKIHDHPSSEVNPYQAESLGDCVKVYLECDHALFLNKGSVSNTVNYISAVFNNIAALYANEDVTIKISEIFVWDTPDAYSITNSVNALYQFRSTRQSFNGDIAHLVTYDDENLGGVAWVDILCYDPLSYAYSNIYSSFNAFPTYSWTVEVFTHEMGHNLGSPHTQNCSWPGGAIDNCYTTEGGCDPGPAPVDGGTIMSYCHLTGYGINFANGFGPLPGDLIRDKVDEAVCLGACDLPPANDWPCSAIEIPVNGNCIFTEATNIGAINSVVPEVTCDGISEGDVWFTCTVGPEEYVIIEMDNGDVISDMGMKLYVGTCTDLSNVPDGCVADGSTYGEDMPGFVVEAPEGTVIFIRVWEVNNDAFGDFSICAYTTCAASIAPDAILADDYIICAGESANLSLDGGSLGSLAQWNWYATSCTGTPLSHDASLTVTPSEMFRLPANVV
jgi:hypothetical protein